MKLIARDYLAYILPVGYIYTLASSSLP